MKLFFGSWQGKPPIKQQLTQLLQQIQQQEAIVDCNVNLTYHVEHFKRGQPSKIIPSGVT